jgi:cell wall-associated NlpC family hydrolase
MSRCIQHSGISSLLLLALLTAGCASAPITDVPGGARHQKASEIAVSMVGRPYRYGGNTPQGFDCSGLVQFSFKRAGMKVPRSSTTQHAKSRKVSFSGLARGDLLFFDLEAKNSHVGIYLGGNRFVHAPSSGKHVRVDMLTNVYWRQHLRDARRF